ncbi:hypothetical protein RIB2604_01808620 [Aspergillus luchuensis]|uniref:Uncharacterized protein n=1 Tax=Aspergillus kawachii TaxID=1069201 RepID=A0A146FGM1_ASPKA|nr:hypothetical protein RIB2604_01808620 [Aspergillus luchuensis]
MVDDSHQKTALGVVVAFPVLGGIAVLLRIWSRYLTRSRLGADIKTNYVGIHIWDIPKNYDIKLGLIVGGHCPRPVSLALTDWTSGTLRIN